MTDYPNNIPAKLEIIKASEITPKEVRWLWYPYIPFGKVTLLQGDPGDGKSMKTGFVERIGGTIFVVNAMPAENAKHTQEELVKALITKEAMALQEAEVA